jgi:two-component system cell cycle response regulator DivK
MTTVLVIDDNAMNRKLACDVLEAAGLRTVEAATAADGIALATEHEPDVILLDLRLPDMPGVEVARRLKGDDGSSRIPIVAMSASSLEEHGEWLEAAGFAGYLDKPIHVGTFPERVRSFCREREGGQPRHPASPPLGGRPAG